MGISLEGWPQGLKIKASQENSVHFYDPETNAVIYFSYLVTTSEKYVKE